MSVPAGAGCGGTRHAPPCPASTAGPAGTAAAARQLHQELLVADLHTHLMLGVGYLGFDVCRPYPWWARRGPLKNLFGTVSIEQARAGGLDLLVAVVYLLPNPWRSYRRALRHQLARLRALCERHAGQVLHARSSAEVLAAREQGKLALMLAVEGGHAIEADLAELELLREHGAIYLTLSHFINNRLAATATHPGRDWGLSARGRELVRQCNRLGILLDITHSSPRARSEVLRLSAQPVIYSHTGLRRFVPAARMTTEEELRAVRAAGGVVGLLLSPYFLNGTLRAGLGDVARNLEHMCEVMGAEHVAIGSDLGSGLPPPTGLRSLADYPALTAALVARGFSRAALAQIWGESLLRTLRAIGR
ncbi:MAG: dipeptidase [Planctomycetota bacterium]|nr:MAG: dipeptidase [Planctomycetota bacterium]